MSNDINEQPQSNQPAECVKSDFQKIWPFYEKHALGPKRAPSCLLCGGDTQYLEVAITHGELPGIVICKPCHDFKQQLTAANEANAALKSDSIRPGVMRCAKCNFQLIRTNLNVGSGTMTAGDNKSEPCPNGCGPLWPMTWKEYGQQIDEAYESVVQRMIKAEDERDETIEYNAQLEQEIARLRKHAAIFAQQILDDLTIRAHLKPKSDGALDLSDGLVQKLAALASQSQSAEGK